MKESKQCIISVVSPPKYGIIVLIICLEGLPTLGMFKNYIPMYLKKDQAYLL